MSIADSNWRLSLAADAGHCRLCGTTTEQRHFWNEVYANSGQQLRRCGHCAGVYLAPGFDEQGIAHFYQERYRYLFPAEVPWKDLTRFFAWRGDRVFAQQRLALINSALPENARLFELGSGFGAFLGAVASKRPDVHLLANEPDRVHRQMLLGGAPVDFIEELSELAPASLEAVVSFHVVEHLPNPLDSLDRLAQVLAPGGQLWLEVPDIRADWRTRLYVHPAHLSYFCAESLGNLVTAAGFEVLACGPHPLTSLQGNLWLHARRTESSTRSRPLAAAPDVIVEIDRWIERVDWRPSDRIRALLKRASIALLGPGLIGEWRRWRQWRQRRQEDHS